MALNDNLANAMSHMMNCEKVGKTTCTVPSSKIIKGVLMIFKTNGYIENFKEFTHGVKSIIEVQLNGNINNCNSIKPRFSVKNLFFEKYEKRYLPSYDLGLLIVSTPTGLITHQEAKKIGLGGRLIAFVY